MLGRLLGKYPVIQFENAITRAEILLEVPLPGAVVKHFLGLEIGQELLHVVIAALAREELSRGNVKETHAAGRLAEVDSGQEVVLFVVEHVVAHGHSWGHQLGDAPLHHAVFLGQPFLSLQLQAFLLGVFQLVADGHALARPDKFGQIGVKGMVGKAGHLNGLRLSGIASAGKRNAKYGGSLDSVLAIGFIKVATTKQQQCVGMLGFHLEKLSHHGGQCLVFLCHGSTRFGQAKVMKYRQMAKYSREKPPQSSPSL